ncbi:retropepsin-like domain-containing protein [Polaribacter sp.]|nr:retropepsin-like domain-containing protein [Polaribacter sp.]
MIKFLNITQILFFCLFFLSISTNGQNGFHFKNNKHKTEQISFQLINNLMVIPLKINGVELSFILDTGSDKTILFNLYANDSVGLKDPKHLKLRGLGVGEPIDALISKKNRVEIKGIQNNNETVFVILKDFFDLSSKMGTTIHGIIGYSFFKNFVVNIN